MTGSAGMGQRSVSVNTLALLVGRTVSAGGALLVAGLAARSLGDSRFGVFVAVVAAGFVANTIVTFGTDTLVIRSTAEGEGVAEAQRSLGVQLPLAGVLVACAAVVATVVGASAGPLLLQALGLLPGVWGTASGSLLRGRQRMDLVALSIGVSSGATVCLAALAYWQAMGVGGFVGSGVAGQVAGAATMSFLAGRTGGAAWIPALRTANWSRARPFAVMVAASGVATAAGVVALQMQGTAIDTSHYAAAHRISEGLQLLPAAVFGAAFPAMSVGLHRTREYLIALRWLVTGSAVVTAGVVVFASPVIGGVYNGFGPSVGVLRILSMALLPLLARLKWSFELISEGHERAVARVASLAASLTVISCLVAATRWGPRAVAASMVGSLMAHAAILGCMRRSVA